jgi:hypothetical protein
MGENGMARELLLSSAWHDAELTFGRRSRE